MKNYTFDAHKGIVFGLNGKPIRKVSGGGYIQVNCGGKPVGMAHRMIWEHVHGPIPDGLQINHKNGIKWDNRLENLEVVTPSENAKHAHRTGLSCAIGERNGRAKLTCDAISQIRSETASIRKIAEKFGVSSRSIRNIRDGISWRSV